MIATIVTRIVEACHRHAAATLVAGLVLAVAAAAFTATHLTVDTDLDHLLPTDLGWRRNEIALDKAFPQNDTLLVIVIDGATGELADQAAARLAEGLRAEPDLFRYVRQPDGGPFFERYGLLFLSKDELQAIADKLVEAQPLIGSIAHDPSLRGLFDTLALFATHAGEGGGADRLGAPLKFVADAVERVLAGHQEPVSWGPLMTGRAADSRDLRHFVLTRPVLDFESLEPGDRARAEVRRLARELSLDPQHGVRVRMTGPVALNDEQFATLSQGALQSTVLSIVLVCGILFAALRSPKLVAAILGTLIAGLSVTAGFAALAIGSLNLISVAFGVLFVGLAVDFGIQFGVRYRDHRHRVGSLPAALRRTALTIGPALTLAAGATAIGFLSFVPTRYTGIRELGWIAGAGMLIAIALNFTFLPAALTLSRPRGEPEPVGFGWLAPLDRFLLSRRRRLLIAAGLLGLGCAALMPWVGFDFDPLDLKNPHTESVSTVRDLMKDPTTTPYTAEILMPDLAQADAMAEQVSALPEVAQAVTASSFIPGDQPEKLAVLGDLALLLGPSLNPPSILPAPTDAEALKSMTACRDALQSLAARLGSDSPAGRLAAALDGAIARGPAVVAPLSEALLSGLHRRIETLRTLIDAKPVSVADLPPELRDSWIAADGRARVEVFPKGDVRDPDVLRRFVAAVRTVAPDVTGSPVTIQEAGHLISSAFVQAGVIAVAAIAVLLTIILRRARDVLLVIAPLLLAALLTMAITVVIGMRLNYANIIALPLLLGIGVAFDIYFVMNWRAGEDRHLQSSTARAVIFSALTTMSAFGSLAISNDPGTAGMGQLLTISLGCTLFCTLFVLPALLGPANRNQPRTEPPAAPAVRGEPVHAEADRSL